MRKITFNKLGAICLFCKKNKVPIEKWNRPCESCKKKRSKAKGTKIDIMIGKRMPAAVLENDKGQKVFVDKHGVPVKDHGYDLENDPRGTNVSGKGKKYKKIIIT